MTTSPTPPEEQVSRDAANWAKQTTTTLKVERTPTGALNLNVEGRRVVGPLQGFGQMWQKTYRTRLEGADTTPAAVIKIWKADFASFWPQGNRFYAPMAGIKPGEVALINAELMGVIPLSTGVMVLYADDESFTLMTPQGHTFSGWVTFSASEEEGCVVVQAQVLLRANDPIYEFGFRFMGAHREEDRIWEHTLTSLALRFGVKAAVTRERVCVDPRMQWAEFRNIWQNATMHTMIYKVGTPVRWARSRVVRKRAV